MPVVSGNVSLYNETDGKAIFPTPTIGAVGIMNDYNSRITMKPKFGDTLWLIGETQGHLGRSALTEEILKIETGAAPSVNLRKEHDCGKLILHLNNLKLLRSCHDLSDGGLALAAVEMALMANCGIKLVDFSTSFLFGEDQARYLVSGLKENEESIVNNGIEANIPIIRVGIVEGNYFSVGSNKIALDELRKLHQSGLSSIFKYVD